MPTESYSCEENSCLLTVASLTVDGIPSNNTLTRIQPAALLGTTALVPLILGSKRTVVTNDTGTVDDKHCEWWCVSVLEVVVVGLW